MKHTYAFVITAISLLSLPCIAQKNNTEPNQQGFKRLYIGDTVPMESVVFSNIRNHPGGKTKLSDFKGKYIILDFWDRGCGSCIEGFPHMEELQNQFKDDIQILLVTKNTEEELTLLLKNSPNVKNTTLPIVMGEQVLTQQMFPIGTHPYHVWLDRSGKVVASTWAQETTATNLKDLIAGKPMDHIMVRRERFPQAGFDDKKKDLLKQFNDPKQSLLTIGHNLELLKYYVPFPMPTNANRLSNSVSKAFSGDGLKKQVLLPYYSTFMEYSLEAEEILYRRGGQFELTDQKNNTIGFRMLNWNIEDIYNLAYSDIRKDRFEKLILEDGARSLYEEKTDSTNRKRYLVNNCYSYESCLPDYSIERAKKLLQLDLARFFGMIAVVEERPLKHVILTRLGTPQEKNLKMKEGDYVELYRKGDYKSGEEGDQFVIKNYPASYISSKIGSSNRASDDPIIIDETGFDKGAYQPVMVNGKNLHKNLIDVRLKLKRQNFHATAANIPILRKELEKYGIGVKEEMRKVKVLVLRASLQN